MIIASARHDENGKIKNGKSGDQTGKEVSKQEWYLHSKGWRVFRWKDGEMGSIFADIIISLADNACVGYDQSQNLTLWKELEKIGWKYDSLNTPCETDCAQLVRCALRCLGIKTSFFTTANEASALLNTGEFEELTSDKYTKSGTYLKRGDILVTKTKGHTVVAVDDGKTLKTTKYKEQIPIGLVHHDKGTDVIYLQKFLNWAYNYNLELDGSYGRMTNNAVEDYKKRNNINEIGFGKKCYSLAISLRR